MSKLTRYEIEGADNDIYCTFNGLPVHIASMGGNIPDRFRDRDVLRQLQKFVGNLTYISNVTLNLQFLQSETQTGYQYFNNPMIARALNDVLGNNVNFNLFPQLDIKIRLYAMSFIDKARKGFYSYARVGEGNEWTLVASPQNPINLGTFNPPLPSINIHLLEANGFNRLELRE